MKKVLYIALFAIFIPALFVGCGEDRTQEFFEQTKENQWIYTTMRSHYLWSNQIKPQERSRFFIPSSNFFSSLLYKEDKASFYSDAIYKGDYGMNVVLKRDPINVTPSQVYALVLSVEPGSPADKAGIRRGTWISVVNGKKLSMSGTSLFKNGDEIKLATEYIEYDDAENKNFWQHGDTLTVEASTSYELCDIVMDSVYTEGGKNIGYILCNRFNNDDFAKRIDGISAKFINNNVTDIVVDLRYTDEGSMSNACYLASVLVPSELAGTPFCTLRKSEKDVNATYEYIHPQYTLCDKKVYFITGSATKGVAELLVSSVNASRDTYDVMTLGENSAGSNVMVEKMVSPYGFSINPATAYLYSSDGTIISNKGITPDYKIDEQAQTGIVYPLGNPQEYILYNAIYLISKGALPM